MVSIKRFAAHYIFMGYDSPPVPRGIIETDEYGTIIRIIKPLGSVKEMYRMEFFNGILCPNFVCLPKSHSYYFPILKKYENILPNNDNDQKGCMSERKIFEWIKNIQLIKDSTNLKDLINLFTIKSSVIAGKEEKLGSFVPGKTPGIIFIDKINYKELRLTPGSSMKKLI